MKMLIICCSLLPAVISSAAVRYSITDLGALDSDRSFARAISNSGTIVGHSYGQSGDGEPFVWDRSLGIRAIAAPGTVGSAWDVNDSGRIVGKLSVPGGSRAFVADAGGALQQLNIVERQFSWATAVNAAGNATGWAFDSVSAPTGAMAFVWGAGSTPQFLDNAGRNWAIADDINDAGVVVGGRAIGSQATAYGTAFAWSASNGYTDIPGLGGSYSAAHAVNNSGQVVGEAEIAGGNAAHAFLWDSSGGTRDLGTLGARYSVANDINNLGQVVGTLTYDPGPRHAFVSENGTLLDLNSLVSPDSQWELQGAWGISDSGQIIGVGSFGPYAERAFLLTPVPEPPSIFLSLAVVLGVRVRTR